jgi:hypothetical protein
MEAEYPAGFQNRNYLVINRVNRFKKKDVKEGFKKSIPSIHFMLIPVMNWRNTHQFLKSPREIKGISLMLLSVKYRY